MASKSASAIYYATHNAARLKKNAYQTKYESTPAQRKYRSKLTVLRRKRKLRGNPNDLSHNKDGSITLENRARNRGRQGADGKSTKR